MKNARILIVDDEPEMLENLDRLLSADGHLCTTLSDPHGFQDVLVEFKPDIVITDLRMPGIDGMGILATAHVQDSSLPIILITGYATVASALQAIQEGAFDYLSKPFTADQLTVVVQRALRFRQLVTENQSLREQMGKRMGTGIVGSSPPFVRLLDQIQRVAPTDANVLIAGESGTGKELIARSIHRHSPRRDAPFVPVDCAALPEGLLETELFGHVKGAFTGAVALRKGLLAEADGGTLFLDEVAEMSLPLQAKLLRVLEERQVRPVGASKHTAVDIRMVAATNRDLDAAVVEGTFREDLFYRLNVVQFRVPPLRARTGDVVLLVQRFLDEFASAAGRQPPTVTPQVWEALDAYEWPGNVRQLRNLVEQIVALDQDGQVTLSDLPPQVRFETAAPARTEPEPHGFLPLKYADAREAALQEFRATYVRGLLEAHQGNVSRAARTAGVSRRTLHRWLAEIEGGAVETGEEAEDGSD
jgi:DNA-binding NtrC family response regulator